MGPAMDEPRIWTAGLLVIGDEILSGRTQDRNVAQIGTWLNLQGIRLREVRMVPDVIEAIAAAANALRGAYDYLFTTGGIGPTHDDITVDAIAHALGRPVVEHAKARAILEEFYATRGGVNEPRLRMARVPQGAELIENRFSGAPGIHVENIYILAGVPRIAAMMLDALEGSLEGGRPLLSHILGGWIQESEVAELLAVTEKAHERCQIGSYPFFRDGRPGANFVIRSDDEAALAACAGELKTGLEALGKDVVDGGV
jgi:molybdopterin-biosynthesis enzyme MoeA-like protein